MYCIVFLLYALQFDGRHGDCATFIANLYLVQASLIEDDVKRTKGRVSERSGFGYKLWLPTYQIWPTGYGNARKHHSVSSWLHSTVQHFLHYFYTFSPFYYPWFLNQGAKCMVIWLSMWNISPSPDKWMKHVSRECYEIMWFMCIWCMHLEHTLRQNLDGSPGVYAVCRK